MPLQYDGILAEHHRTRTDVTMFDTCHMGRFLVTGPGSLAAEPAALGAGGRRHLPGQPHESRAVAGRADRDRAVRRRADLLCGVPAQRAGLREAPGHVDLAYGCGV